MSLPRVLLSGAGGQLGQALQARLGGEATLFALSHREWDISDEAMTQKLCRDLRPEFVINAAAYTAVDRAEEEVEQAFASNGHALRVIGGAAAAVGATVIHYSTDYVFDGSKQAPYNELDRPAPLNVYGRSKLEGEVHLAAALPAHYIFRSSWLFGVGGSNFAHTMLNLAKQRNRITVVDDQWGVPTAVTLIADITADVICRAHPANGLKGVPWGLYHLSAQGATTWCRYAQYLFAQAGLGTVVAPIPSSAYPQKAQRPMNSRLDCSKLEQALGYSLPPWQEGVKAFLATLTDQRNSLQP